MQVLASITETKNLSQSSLILRNLVSDLQVGEVKKGGRGLLQDKVPFELTAAEADACLVLSIRNLQTASIMYELSVPLTAVSLVKPLSCWVALQAPGEQQQRKFHEAAPPRVDQPQIHLEIRCVLERSSEGGAATVLTSSGGSPDGLGRASLMSSETPQAAAAGEDIAALQQQFTKLEEELEQNRLQASRMAERPSMVARPSVLQKEAAEIQAKERQMASIKAKLASMGDAQRQAKSAEEQLGEVTREVERQRERLAAADDELRALAARRTEIMQVMGSMRETIQEAKETLRLRDLSIAELRSNRDETERQLNQTLEEREQSRASANAAQQGFDSEARSASAELENVRSEAQQMTEAIEGARRRDEELQRKIDGEQASSNGKGAGLADLQSELDQVIAELKAHTVSRDSDSERLAEAEQSRLEAEMRLKDAENVVQQTRAELQEAASEAREATEGVKRELALKLARAAQLEGSLAENKNQLKDITQHADALTKDLQEKSPKSDVLTSLASELEAQEEALAKARAEKEALQVALQRELDQSSAFREQSETAHKDQKNGLLALSQETDMLATTRKVADNDLAVQASEFNRLQEMQAALGTEITETDAKAQEADLSRQDAKRKIEDVQQKLQETKERKAKLTDVVGTRQQRAAELEKDLQLARDCLDHAVKEAMQLKATAAKRAADNSEREEALRERVAQLKDEMVSQQRTSEEGQNRLTDVADILAQTVSELTASNEQAEVLRSEHGAVQSTASDLRRVVEAARRSIDAQASQLKFLDEQLGKQHEELGSCQAEASDKDQLRATLGGNLTSQQTAVTDRVQTQRDLLVEKKDYETKMEEQLSNLRVQRAELALKQESVAASCTEAREQLAELKASQEEARTSADQQLKSAERDLEAKKHAITLETRLAQLGKELAAAKAKAAAARGGLGRRQTHAEVSAALEQRRAETAAVQKSLDDCREQAQTLLWELGKGGSSSSSSSQGQRRPKAEEVQHLRKKKATLQEQLASPSLAAYRAPKASEEFKMLMAEIQAARDLLETARSQLDERMQGPDSPRMPGGDSARRRSSFGLPSGGDSGRRSSAIVLATAGQDGLSPRQFFPSASPANGAATGAPLWPPSPATPSLLGSEALTLGSQEQKLSLLEEQLQNRAESLRQATKETQTIEASIEGLRGKHHMLQEEHEKQLAQASAQAEKANHEFSSVQELEKALQTSDEETELLSLGLHEAEHHKEFLDQEHALMKTMQEGRYPGTIQQWAEEVQRLRMAAKLQFYKDELDHWRQAADVGREKTAAQPVASETNSKQQAAEEQLKQRLRILEEALRAREQQLRELEEEQARQEEVPGSVRSVPSALHGLLSPAPASAPVQRRALVIGCNYSGSWSPLQGCANDAWNVQCLLRQSLRYSEDQVRCLVDCSPSLASPAKRQPTRDNILSGLRWLTASAMPGDNIILYFSGYGTQQPDSSEGFLVPSDFAEDLPEEVVKAVEAGGGASSSPSASAFQLPADLADKAAAAGGYRLVPMSALTEALRSLPASCKATLVLDCCQSASLQLAPGLDASWSGVTGPLSPTPASRRPALLMSEATQAALGSSRAAGTHPALPGARPRLLELPALPTTGGTPSPSTSRRAAGMSPMGSPIARTVIPGEAAFAGSPVPVLPSLSNTSSSPVARSKLPASPDRSPVAATKAPSGTGPSCKCYCFAACQSDQVCAELPIEGLVQGAATWAFVKAITACHLTMTLQQHSKVLDGILQNLRRKYRWIQQSPVIQLSSSASLEDHLISP